MKCEAAVTATSPRVARWLVARRRRAVASLGATAVVTTAASCHLHPFFAAGQAVDDEHDRGEHERDGRRARRPWHWPGRPCRR